MIQDKFALPIHWNDHEDIAMGLYEKFGDDFDESKIYRIRFTDLLEWVLSLPDFKGTREAKQRRPPGANSKRLGLRVAG
jgi:FeS assembly protein IscX